MTARSAKNHSTASVKAQNQLPMDGAVNSATSLLSNPQDSITNLANGLKLTIDLHTEGAEAWLKLQLEDEMNLALAAVQYPVICTSLDRRYHLRESVVIAMRRLMEQAFSQQMISDYPGELLSVLTPPPERQDHTATPLEEDSILSSTDLASLLDSSIADMLRNM